MTLEGCECWRQCCDLGPHACICGNDCDRDETTGIPMAELRDAGVGQHLRPLQDELDRIADELASEVERLRSDPTLALMGSQLEKLAAERDRLKAEVGQLRDVKAEWRMYCIRAESERDQLKATVERVRDLSTQVAHDPAVEGMTLQDFGRIDHALAVLAALDGDDGEGEA